jgi:hypothetical protein
MCLCWILAPKTGEEKARNNWNEVPMIGGWIYLIRLRRNLEIRRKLNIYHLNEEEENNKRQNKELASIRKCFKDGSKRTQEDTSAMILKPEGQRNEEV